MLLLTEPESVASDAISNGVTDVFRRDTAVARRDLLASRIRLLVNFHRSQYARVGLVSNSPNWQNSRANSVGVLRESGREQFVNRHTERSTAALESLQTSSDEHDSDTHGSG